MPGGPADRHRRAAQPRVEQQVTRPLAGGDVDVVGVRVVDHDVGGVVGLDLGRQVRVDLNAVVPVLGLDGE